MACAARIVSAGMFHWLRKEEVRALLRLRSPSSPAFSDLVPIRLKSPARIKASSCMILWVGRRLSMTDRVAMTWLKNVLPRPSGTDFRSSRSFRKTGRRP